MKNKIFSFITFLLLTLNYTFASWPEVVCNWLPWCENEGIWEAVASLSWNDFFWFLWNIISEWIKYVAVLAVLALMVSWFMYLISSWEDEKVAKAKKAIIWSLVWVLLSTSAWVIINIVNNFKIN